MSSKQRIKRSLNGEEIIANNKNVNQNEAGSSEPAAKKHKGYVSRYVLHEKCKGKPIQAVAKFEGL